MSCIFDRTGTGPQPSFIGLSVHAPSFWYAPCLLVLQNIAFCACLCSCLSSCRPLGARGATLDSPGDTRHGLLIVMGRACGATSARVVFPEFATEDTVLTVRRSHPYAPSAYGWLSGSVVVRASDHLIHHADMKPRLPPQYDELLEPYCAHTKCTRSAPNTAPRRTPLSHSHQCRMQSPTTSFDTT